VAETLRCAERAALEGLELNFERAVATGTFQAHRLIALAARQERAEQMVERLFRAHFKDGLHMGDLGTLAELAEEAGVTMDDFGADELRARLDQVRRLGLSGVPVFFIDGVAPLIGSQPESALFAALKEEADTMTTA
jgi:predicted DsbA family dithiol-disulfide isomerase